MVLPARLRVHCQYGPCSAGGSAWQRQLAQPQRTRRCMRVPGSARPGAASSAAIGRARSCWLRDTYFIVARVRVLSGPLFSSV